MSSEHQIEKKKARTERIQMQRERRSIPPGERVRPLGLGTNRAKLQAETQKEESKQAKEVEATAKPTSQPKRNTSSQHPHRDRIEISEEAIRKFREIAT